MVKQKPEKKTSKPEKLCTIGEGPTIKWYIKYDNCMFSSFCEPEFLKEIKKVEKKLNLLSNKDESADVKVKELLEVLKMAMKNFKVSFLKTKMKMKQ